MLQIYTAQSGLLYTCSPLPQQPLESHHWWNPSYVTKPLESGGRKISSRDLCLSSNQSSAMSLDALFVEYLLPFRTMVLSAAFSTIRKIGGSNTDPAAEASPKIILEIPRNWNQCSRNTIRLKNCFFIKLFSILIS